LKEIERKLISELLKNSRRSDRELAKAIGTSQQGLELSWKKKVTSKNTR
jgi:DNA-binding Lrp family transcriptional regulator